jgi:membrane protease subunit HflK
MAWNEPGNGKDPWGGNTGNQGPPDIDEALKKLRSRISGIFGGAGNGDKKPGNKGGKGIFGVFLAILITGWSLSGFYQVDEKEQASCALVNIWTPWDLACIGIRPS